MNRIENVIHVMDSNLEVSPVKLGGKRQSFKDVAFELGLCAEYWFKSVFA